MGQFRRGGTSLQKFLDSTAAPAGAASQVQSYTRAVLGSSLLFVRDENDIHTITPDWEDVATLATGGAGTVGSPWTGWVTPANASSRKVLYFRNGYYQVGAAESLEPDDGVTVLGEGYASVIVKAATPSTPAIDIDGKEFVTIQSILVDGGGNTDPDSANIFVQGASENITIRQVVTINGYAGIDVWRCQGLRVLDCIIYDHSHCVVLGEEEDGPVIDSLISGCTIYNSALDGIKTQAFTNDLVIDGNVIYDCDYDAIDLFASGDRIVISNNILKDCGINGLDIKRDDPLNPPEDWGNNQNCLIIGNRICGNAWAGVKIARQTAYTPPYNYMICGNYIQGNGRYGVLTMAPGTAVVGNHVIGNCTDTDASLQAIYFLGDAGGQRVTNCLCDGNIVTNNGCSVQTNVGIALNEAEEITITGNMVDNIAAQDNPNQDWGLLLIETDDVVVSSNIFGSGLAISINPGLNGNYEALGNLPTETDNKFTVILMPYAKASLPTAAAGRIVYVTDEAGGPCPAYYDGTNWRRFSDGAVVS